MNIYPPDKIKLWSNKITKPIIIPDLIISKEGIACGDKISLIGEIDDGIVNFSFYTEHACLFAKASCNLFCEKYSGLHIKYAKSKINTELEKALYSDYLFDIFELDKQKFMNRKKCLLAPVELISQFIKQIQSLDYVQGEKPSTIDTMECDACVSSCRINWSNKKTVKIDHHGDRVYSTDYLKKWLPLGKIELLESDIENLRNACINMSDQDHQFLSDHTMNSFVLNNLRTFAPELINDKWKATEYLVQKSEITTRYFKKIQNYILENNLSIYMVKGYVSQKYYEYPALRIHSDFDVIAQNSHDAFVIANFLIENGFSIRPNLFSFKKMTCNGNLVYSGHFHVQKIINDTYMFEIDISFPGFPINRVELFSPHVDNNEISLEDQVLITLLHLFKHSNIYMKDINDLYYMLQEDLEFSYLKYLINKYHLNLFFNIVVMYIYSNYNGVEKKFNLLIDEFNMDKNILSKYIDWPYNKEIHIKAKKDDFSFRIQNNLDYEREYLYPVIIFKELFWGSEFFKDFQNDFSVERIFDDIYLVTNDQYQFYLTPIGILINSYIDTSNLKRIEFIKKIQDFLNICGIKEIVDIPYATEHFYVRVI